MRGGAPGTGGRGEEHAAGRGGQARPGHRTLRAQRARRRARAGVPFRRDAPTLRAGSRPRQRAPASRAARRRRCAGAAGAGSGGARRRRGRRRGPGRSARPLLARRQPRRGRPARARRGRCALGRRLVAARPGLHCPSDRRPAGSPSHHRAAGRAGRAGARARAAAGGARRCTRAPEAAWPRIGGPDRARPDSRRGRRDLPSRA